MLDDLVTRLRAGSAAAREELYNSLHNLIGHQVKALVSRNLAASEFADDLVSAGSIALIAKIDDVAGTKCEVTKSLFGIVIKRAIEREWQGIAKRQQREKQFDFEGPCDLLDDLSACCHSGNDRLIVNMRAAGYTVREIEKSLKVSRTTISRVLGDIEDRYNTLATSA